MEEIPSVWAGLASMMERRLGRIGPVVTTVLFCVVTLTILLFCGRLVYAWAVAPLWDAVSALEVSTPTLRIGGMSAFLIAALLLVWGMFFQLQRMTSSHHARRILYGIIARAPSNRSHLLQAILGHAQANEGVNSPPPPDLEGYTEEQIGYIVLLCKDAWLIEVRANRKRKIEAISLTVYGIEALERLREHP